MLSICPAGHEDVLVTCQTGVKLKKLHDYLAEKVRVITTIGDSHCLFCRKGRRNVSLALY